MREKIPPVGQGNLFERGGVEHLSYTGGCASKI
jgi:hypothetical protein